MAEGGGLRRRQLLPKLTMEEYLDFIHSQKQLDFTVHHLNQIIDMHGFKKIHRTHKNVLVEVVKTMDLMDPSRSTVGDAGVSSDAFIPLDDLVMDLNELKWQECCVTSLQTFNAVDHQQMQEETSNIESSALTVASASSGKPKRPRKKLKKLVDNGPGSDLPLTSFKFGGSQTALCSATVMKWVPTKKRSMKYIKLNAHGNDAKQGSGGSSSSSASLPLGWY